MTLSFDIFKSEAAEFLSAIQAVSVDRDSGQEWSVAAIVTLLQNPGTEALVASEDHGPIGFLMSRRTVPEAEILYICVLPAHREKTVGHQLIRQFQRRAESAGIREIFLEVNEYNTAALALYGKNGFETVGRRRDYYGRRGGRKQDALIMKYLVR